MSFCPLTDLLNNNHAKPSDKPQMSMTSLRKKRLQQNLSQQKGNNYDTQVITEISIGNQVLSLSELNGKSPFGGSSSSSSSTTTSASTGSGPSKREKHVRAYDDYYADEDEDDEQTNRKIVAPNFVDSTTTSYMDYDESN